MNLHHIHKHFAVVPMESGDTLSMSRISLCLLDLKQYTPTAVLSVLKELMHKDLIQDGEKLFLIDYNGNHHVLKSTTEAVPHLNGYGYYCLDIFGKQVNFSLVQQERVLVFHHERRHSSDLYTIVDGAKQLNLSKAQAHYSSLFHTGYLPEDIQCLHLSELYDELNEGIFGLENAYVLPVIH